MAAGKRALVIAVALFAVSLSGGPARAQNPLGQPTRAWRQLAWWRSAAGTPLLGGEIVGSSAFATGWQPAPTFTAAQWNEMAAAQARQTPALSAAQWNQLVTGQARQPAVPTPSRAQQFDAMRAAAAHQQRQMFEEALRQLRQQMEPPPPPHQ